MKKDFLHLKPIHRWGGHFRHGCRNFSGTDQSAIVLIALSLMLEQNDNYTVDELKSVKSLMHHFADGIRMMQVVSPGKLPDGAFFKLGKPLACIWKHSILCFAHGRRSFE